MSKRISFTAHGGAWARLVLAAVACAGAVAGGAGVAAGAVPGGAGVAAGAVPGGAGVAAPALVAHATATNILTLYAGTGTPGTPVPGPAASSPLGSPQSVALDSTGDLYVADLAADEVLKITPGGRLSVVAGTGAAGAPVPGPAIDSPLNAPAGVAVDAAGDVYIADGGNSEIEKVTPDGMLSVIAGTGVAGRSTPGPALASQLSGPTGVAVDAGGDLYIADTGNCQVDEMTPGGTLTTLAGTGTCGTPGPGPATQSPLKHPRGIVADDAGHVYVADSSAEVVEEIAGGTLSIVAGRVNRAGAPAAGAATLSRLNYPSGVTLDGAGDLFIADQYNGRIEEVTAGRLSIVAGAGRGVPTYGAAATSSRLDWPTGIAIDPDGLVFISEAGGGTIDRVAPAPPAAVIPPAVSGSARQGQTLTAAPGAWSNAPTSFAYAWELCDASGAGCATIPGATGTTYDLIAADVGHTIRAVVTAASQTGATTAPSAPTATILPLPPAAVTAPVISGTATNTETLTASPGSWTSNPAAFTYVWQDCDAAGDRCTAIAGATAARYTLQAGDIGDTIRVVVTAANAGGSAGRSSGPTSPVAPAVTPWANTPPPAPAAAPAVAGIPAVGRVLTCAAGDWTGAPALTLQWNRDHQAIAGATGATYAVSPSDAGHTLTCTVVATNAGGSITAESNGISVPGPAGGAGPDPRPGGSSCPGSAEAIRGAAVGPLRLGETAAGVDRCLTPADGTIHVVYAPAGMTATIARAHRSPLAGHVVLLVTSELTYTLHGVRAGSRAADLRAAVHHLGRPILAGGGRWYVIPGRRAGALVEVRGGAVRAVGVIDLRLGHAAVRRLLRSS